MRTIRWGIIGCGDVTEVKSGPAFQKADNSKLVAVMRRSGELAADYARRHNVPKWYDNAESLINDADVDAVYIATPPSSHKKYTLMTANAGKPVYVEKPMALNFAECKAMIEACKTENVPLFTAYYRRALPRFLKIKELIETGVIGQVRFIDTKLYQPISTNDINQPWRVVPEISGGGHFVDLASHQLDFFDYLFGATIKVEGAATNQAGEYAAEDIVTGTYLFESGVHGTGTWCFTAFEKFDLSEIVGSKGKISFSTFDAKPIILTTAEGAIEFQIDYPAHIQQPLIQKVVNELNGIETSPSSGETASRTTLVMEQMLKSYYG